MARPFVFRINAAELFTHIQGMNNDEKAVFITQLSVDFITLKASSDYSKGIIDETLQFIEKKRINGSKGGRPKTETKAKVKLNKSEGEAKAKPEAEAETETEVEEELKEEKSLEAGTASVKPKRPRTPKLSDEEWMTLIKANPAYVGIDIDRLIGKCQAWCLTKGKTITRARILNWLNREETPLTGIATTRPKSYREQVNQSAVDAFVNGDY